MERNVWFIFKYFFQFYIFLFLVGLGIKFMSWTDPLLQQLTQGCDQVVG